MLRPAEAPEPEPGRGELVIDVGVAEVLFLDTQLRAGWGREFFDIQPPFVPGVGVAGTVAALGAGVPEHWRGRRVIAGTSDPGEYRGGGYAERAVVPTAGAHEIPEGLDAAHAIAALHDGVMGVSRLEKSGVGAGDVALVTAASGSIGTWLIPLLKARGATVIAAARGERKLALARDRRDIADVAVRALLERDLAGQSVAVTGPEVLTQREQAAAALAHWATLVEGPERATGDVERGIGHPERAMRLPAPDVVLVAPLENRRPSRRAPRPRVDRQERRAAGRGVTMDAVGVDEPLVGDDQFAIRFTFLETVRATGAPHTTTKLSLCTVRAGRIVPRRGLLLHSRRMVLTGRWGC